MSKVNVTPGDLAGMITRLKGFESQLGAMSNQMTTYARGLEASWKDPQYQQFMISIKGVGQQLKSNMEMMRQMGMQLRTLKQNVEKTQQDFRRQQRK